MKQGDAWFALERKDDEPLEISPSRLEVLGPVTSRARHPEAETALLALEGQGRILRGRFTPEATICEWCDRRLLARIHRYTLNKLRAEIEPVSAADFMRFLLHWQHVAGEDQVKGADGLTAVVEQLEGFELAAAAWENDVLPARVADYGAEQIDRLCLSGRVAWGRLTPGTKAPLRSSPIASCCASTWALGRREAAMPWSCPRRRRRCARRWRSAAPRSSTSWSAARPACRASWSAAWPSWRARASPPRTASPDCARCSRRQDKRKGLVETAGRWASAHLADATMTSKRSRARCSSATASCSASLLQRESHLPPWRELVRVYRRLEARGEIRGGRFVAGFGGEQFAAPDAVGRLRAVRKSEKIGELVVLSAADPLNLVGILTPEARVAAIHRNRILFQDGLPIAAVEGGQVRRACADPISTMRR